MQPIGLRVFIRQRHRRGCDRRSFPAGSVGWGAVRLTCAVPRQRCQVLDIAGAGVRAGLSTKANRVGRLHGQRQLFLSQNVLIVAGRTFRPPLTPPRGAYVLEAILHKQLAVEMIVSQKSLAELVAKVASARRPDRFP